MPTIIQYQIPQAFPAYKRMEEQIEQAPPNVQNWWYDVVQPRLVETLWSIIKGDVPVESQTAVGVNDLFTWSRSNYSALFWEAVYMRINRGNYTYGGNSYWN